MSTRMIFPFDHITTDLPSGIPLEIGIYAERLPHVVNLVLAEIAVDRSLICDWYRCVAKLVRRSV
jgi:hypothetical protein